MPANLTPQYLEAEREYKQAQTAEERLAGLKKMWALLPKHKGTDKFQAFFTHQLNYWGKVVRDNGIRSD